MLQRNISVTNSLVNGTIGIVTEIKNGFDMKPDKIIKLNAFVVSLNFSWSIHTYIENNSL